MKCKDITTHLIGTEEIKKLLRKGDTLISFFYIHEQIHQGSLLHTELDKNSFDNIGIIVARDGTKRLYRLSEYLKNEGQDERGD